MEEMLNKFKKVVNIINIELNNNNIDKIKQKKVDLEDSIKMMKKQNMLYVEHQNKLISYKSSYDEKMKAVAAVDKIILSYKKQNRSYQNNDNLTKRKLLKSVDKMKQKCEKLLIITGINWEICALETKKAGAMINYETGNKTYFQIPNGSDDVTEQIYQLMLSLANYKWKQLIHSNE